MTCSVHYLHVAARYPVRTMPQQRHRFGAASKSFMQMCPQRPVVCSPLPASARPDPATRLVEGIEDSWRALSRLKGDPVTVCYPSTSDSNVSGVPTPKGRRQRLNRTETIFLLLFAPHAYVSLTVRTRHLLKQ
jgi:hypothetical protein